MFKYLKISIEDKCYELPGIAVRLTGGICSDCGNGICEDVESVCTCSKDCVGKGKSDYSSIQEFCNEGDELVYCDNPSLSPEDKESSLCKLCG